jgi:uncharacterized protein (DUF433 family)
MAIDSIPLPEFLTRDDHGVIRLSGHRITLQDVLFFYNEGYSPEMLAGEFPTLPLSLIHKVIAFYLEHEQPCDEYAAEERRASEALRSSAGAEGINLAELRRRMAARQPPCYVHR